MILGQRIRFLREQLGLTQFQLGEKAQISGKAVGRYENGNRVPSVTIAERIAGALGISVNELLYPEELRVNTPFDFFNLDLERLQARLDIRSDKISDIIKNFDKLNEAGQQKLIDYAKDLTRISGYKLSKKERAERNIGNTDTESDSGDGISNESGGRDEPGARNLDAENSIDNFRSSTNSPDKGGDSS